jgi:hypothetical protein
MPDPTISTGDSGYAPVNGLEMYHEVNGAGSGRPLVLLHWSCSTATCPPSASTPAGSSRRWPTAARSSAWRSRPTATPPTSTARCPSRAGPATPSPCCAIWGSGRPTCSASAPGRRWGSPPGRGRGRLSSSSTAGSPRWRPALPARMASSVPRCPGSRCRSRGRRVRRVRRGRRDRNRVGGARVPVRASGDPQVAALVIHASSCSHCPQYRAEPAAIPGSRGELCRNGRGRPR